MSTFRARAFANIALIKYMGKSEGNVPLNSSLSYLLPHLISQVELEVISESSDRWESLDPKTFQLQPAEVDKFLSFFSDLKLTLKLSQNFIVRSTNNFPKGTGLASSASSFAALTLAAAEAALGLTGQRWDREKLANLSRRGSGSSCRSFFGPWTMWSPERVSELDLPLKNLLHIAVLLEEKNKTVSSSDAHKRVLTSLLYEHRAERAETRLKILSEALRAGEWDSAYRICWSEFWDMHSLFETSHRSFGYMTPKSLQVLSIIRNYWEENGDGPLVTMDAGPNIHLLFRSDQRSMYEQMRADTLQGFVLLGSEP